MRSGALLLLLASCAETAGFVDAAGEDPIFVAVITGAEGYNAPEALPSGRFLVEEGCLIFQYGPDGGEMRTPLLPSGSRIAQDGGTHLLMVGGARVQLGKLVTVAGGDLPSTVGNREIPRRCPQEVMLVTQAVRT